MKFKIPKRDDIPLIPEIIGEDDNSIVPIQDGHGLKNIKIDENALNRNFLKIRFLNGRKLNNKLLKQDYKISKIMKEAMKFDKNIHK